MKPSFTFQIGLELEATVINRHTGQAIVNFSNTALFPFLNEWLQTAGHQAAHTEFDAATVELVGLPTTSLDDAFQQIEKTMSCANAFLDQHDMTLLLMGLHPGRKQSDLVITDNPRCYKSLEIMNNRGRCLFYNGFQLNLECPLECNQFIIPLCQALQGLMWPFTIVTQASSVLASTATDYQAYRVYLNDSISHLRSGPFPIDCVDIPDYHRYCQSLPYEASLDRNENTWFDILPKRLTTDNHYRIELRAADTSTLAKLKAYSLAMLLNYHACLRCIAQQQPLPMTDLTWFKQNRSNMIKYGRYARIAVDKTTDLDLQGYLHQIWKPWAQVAANEQSINMDDLIDELLAPTLSEFCLAGLDAHSGDELAMKMITS